MNEENPAIDEAIQEELVAYLDGELDTEASNRVERRLADDVEYRLQLQKLQQAWDLLDQLPRSSVSEQFTQSTVEMIAIRAAEAATNEKSRRSSVKLFAWLGTVAAALLAAAIGYFIVHRISTAENRQLARDLPLIENVDLYSQVDSIEFLRLLDQEGLFADEDASLSEVNAVEEASDVP